MLRFAVLLLVLANVAYFAWSRWVGNEPPAVPATKADRAPRLLLANEAAGKAPADAAVPTQGGCISIGPFLDVSDVARASTSLTALGMTPRQRNAEGTVWTGYWVSLDGIRTRVEADSIVARLRNFGVSDAYVMDGPEPLTIFMGLYTEEQRALRRLDEVKALGYSAKIDARERAGPVYWVDVDVPPGSAAVDTSVFQGDSGRILRLDIKPCGVEAATSQPAADAGLPSGTPG